MTRNPSWKIGAIAAALAAGCVGPTVPVERVATAQAAIRAADEVGAARSPQAALHLKLATEQLAQAKRMIEDDEVGRADLVLQRAEADAELALVLAREDATRGDALRALEQVRAIERKSP